MAIRSRTPVVATTLLLAATVGLAAAGPQVLRVCNGSTFPCPRGTQLATISQAIRRARPGDWVLVWPGVYHEKGSNEAGVLITTPSIHLRGLDRNLVIVDGSNGTAAQPCPSDKALQDFTPRNGIEVLKVDGTSVENLTVCNYLANGEGGNEIWWNGGDGSGTMGMGRYAGAYLNATSMYYESPTSRMAMYGIFASN